MNIRSYLDSLSIPYQTKGSNVGRDDIAIHCPFCGRSDPSMHLSIYTRDSLGLFHCWVCGTRGNLIKLIMKLEGISYEQAIEKYELEPLPEGDITEEIQKILNPPIEERVRFEKISLPDGAKEITGDYVKYPLLWKYLVKRGITKEMCYKYNIHYCKFGLYAHRLIIPVYDRVGDQVGFVARDMTEKAELRYRYPKGFPTKDYLFGLNLFRGTQVILVEGCLDAIRVGTMALASFGKSLSMNQKLLLSRLGLSEIAICYDGDAFKESYKLGQEMYSIVPKVKVIQLPKDKDPADLGGKVIQKLVADEAYI